MFDKLPQPTGLPPIPPLPPMPGKETSGTVEPKKEEENKEETELVGHPILDKPSALESGRLDPAHSSPPPPRPRESLTPPPPPSGGTTIQNPTLHPAKSHKLRWVILLVVIVALLAVLGVWVYVLNRPTGAEEAPVVKVEEKSASSSTDDTDKDGLFDIKERDLGTNINDPDSDKDGLTDKEEVEAWNTDPLISDTDKDGFLDGQEVDNGYNPAGPGRLFNVNDIDL